MTELSSFCYCFALLSKIVNMIDSKNLHCHVPSLKAVSCWASRDAIVLKSEAAKKIPQTLFEWSIAFYYSVEVGKPTDVDQYLIYSLYERSYKRRYWLRMKSIHPAVLLSSIRHICFPHEPLGLPKICGFLRRLVTTVLENSRSHMAELEHTLHELSRRMVTECAAGTNVTVMSSLLWINPGANLREVILQCGGLLELVGDGTSHSAFLSVCAGCGQLDVVQEAIIEGVDEETYSWMVLAAVKAGELPVLKYLMAARTINDNNLRYDMLDCAVKRGNLETLKLLNNPDFYWSPLLMRNVRDSDVAKYILSVLKERREQLLDIFDCDYLDVVVLDLLEEEAVTPEFPDYPSMRKSIMSYRPVQLREFVDAGADVNSCEGSDSAIVLATQVNNILALSLLLLSGADANKTGYLKRTALFYAHEYRIVEKLLAFKADVNVIDNEGLTPLEVTLRVYRDICPEVIDLYKTAEFNFPKYGYAVLAAAIRKGQSAYLVAALVDAGCPLSHPGSPSIVHVALEVESSPCVIQAIVSSSAGVEFLRTVDVHDPVQLAVQKYVVRG